MNNDIKKCGNDFEVINDDVILPLRETKKVKGYNFSIIKEKNVKNKIRGFEPVVKEHLKSYKKINDVILPLRGTKQSAGYDFFLPKDIMILGKQGMLIWSDVKAYMQHGEVFEIYPRSSIAIKYNIRIKNIVGIIDADYYSNIDNDGNIGLFLWNFGNEIQKFKKGEAICQGIFKSFLESDNCNNDVKRIGGVGSTSK